MIQEEDKHAVLAEKIAKKRRKKESMAPSPGVAATSMDGNDHQIMKSSTTPSSSSVAVIHDDLVDDPFFVEAVAVPPAMLSQDQPRKLIGHAKPRLVLPSCCLLASSLLIRSINPLCV
jgi:hypothetical protein